MNKDQVDNLNTISKYSIMLAEAIVREIKENSNSYIEELPGILANLQRLLKNERSMKKKIWKKCHEDLVLLEESDLGDPRTRSTYDGKVAEICRTCRNNLTILKATRRTATAEDQIDVLKALIQNHENIIEKVENLVLMKFTQHQQRVILDQLEQEKPEPFDIMHNYATPFSPNLQRDEDAVASSGYRLSMMTKLLSESKKEPIENKNLDVDDDDDDDVKGLDDELTLRNMMGLEHETLISNPKVDGLRRESFSYFLNTSTDFHFRKNTVFVAMLTVHKFLDLRIINKKRLNLLRYACLSLAAKMNQRRYNELEVLLKHLKSQGIDGETLGRMEWSIMKALDWKIHVVTPFVFTKFFLSRFFAHYSLSESRKDAIRIKSDKIILNVVEDGSLLKYEPSQIAVGATLLALDDALTVEAFGVLPLKGLFNIVDLFKCYDKLRDLMKSPSSYFFL